MIAAHDPNLVIGKDGLLPWHIPEDLAHFKNRTRGHAVVMGRGVFEELNEKPLPGRRNVVLTRSSSYEHVDVCRSRDEVLALLCGENKIYIIGGAEIYRLFYPICDRLEMTHIHNNYQGDTFFPEYRHEIGTVWEESAREELGGITFVDYERIRKS
jgi:dihydrofolate reductase